MNFLKIKILVFLAIFIQFNGCTHLIKTPDPNLDELDIDISSKSAQQYIFNAQYDEVWRAAHATLKYTIAAENQDFGVIETDFIKAVDGWLPPFRNKPQYPAARYKLILTFAKGLKNKNGLDTVRVTIEKKIEIYKDFVSEVKIVPSDGLEESMIFYRMEREIIIDQAIKKALSK